MKPIRRGQNVPKLNFNNLDNTNDLQRFYNKQIYTKGFDGTVNAGSTTNIPISLGGSARRLYGICVYSEIPTDFDKINLVINSEQLINDVVWFSYNPQGQSGNIFKENQFFPLPRPLSGSDDVKFNWNAINTHKVYIVFYLSDSNEDI